LFSRTIDKTCERKQYDVAMQHFIIGNDQMLLLQINKLFYDFNYCMSVTPVWLKYAYRKEPEVTNDESQKTK